MKIRVLSDLHLEFINSAWAPPEAECDVVVLAGDIHVGANALPWIEKHFPDKPVIYICGNHEGYRHDLPQVVAELNAKVPENVLFLDDDWTPITANNETVWFFGGTLWTDFALDGEPDEAMFVAARCMSDYYVIQNGAFKLTPQDTREFHRLAREQIEAGLTGNASCGMGKCVVVTHHLPSRQSVDSAYRASSANPAYASDMEALMRGPFAPVLWIHGHTHRSKDYRIGNTRVVCNPKGYPSGEGKNPDFNPTLVVEV